MAAARRLDFDDPMRRVATVVPFRCHTESKQIGQHALFLRPRVKQPMVFRKVWTVLYALVGLFSGTAPCYAVTAETRGGAAYAGVRLQITPASVRLVGSRATQRLLVTALWPDGACRDVTDEAAMTSATPRIAAVSKSDEVLPRADGQAIV